MCGLDTQRAGRDAHHPPLTPHKTPATRRRSKSLREWHGLDGLRAGSPQEQAQQHTHDVGVVVSFGYFMPPHILAAMGRGSVNMHPSLLPKVREGEEGER